MTLKDDFLPTDYLEASRLIESSVKTGKNIEKNKDSPWIRIGLSRAYYAVFLVLREQIRSEQALNKILRGDEKDHVIIIETLKRLKTIDYKFSTFSNKLSKLRRFRNHSDYDVPFVDPPLSLTLLESLNNNAQEIIENAPAIIEKISKNSR